MSYKLIPRFHYTLSLWNYLSAFFSTDDTDKPVSYFGKRKPYFHNSGRTGLRLLLASIGEKRLTVGVQAYTCHSVFKAIHKAGHDIMFIDIDEHFQMDLQDLKKKAGHIDVLIITHTFGNLEKFDDIREVTGQDKLIIEDCAHAYGSYYSKGSIAGSKGDASIFSFGLGKLPPVGQLGCTILNQPENFPFFVKEYKKLQKEGFKNSLIHSLKTMAFSLAMKKPLYGMVIRRLGKKLDTRFDFIDKFGFHESSGFAADKRLFQRNSSRFQKLIEHNRKNFETLRDRLPTVVIGNTNPEEKPNAYIAALRVDNRDELFELLLNNQIEAGKHFYQSLTWAKEFGYQTGMCPKTEILREQIITVPIHISVSQDDIRAISEIIEEHGKSKT